VGDELHHFGWNACSSCCDDPRKVRRFLILTGLKSSRIYIVDTINPKEPIIHKTIEPETIKEKANLSSPHTVILPIVFLFKRKSTNYNCFLFKGSLFS
jgi:methanethiol oxidase